MSRLAVLCLGVARLAPEERTKSRPPPDSGEIILLLTNKPAERIIHICAAVLFPDLRDLAFLLAMPRLRHRRHHRHNLLFLLPAATPAIFHAA